MEKAEKELGDSAGKSIRSVTEVVVSVVRFRNLGIITKGTELAEEAVFDVELLKLVDGDVIRLDLKETPGLKEYSLLVSCAAAVPDCVLSLFCVDELLLLFID